MLTNRNSEISRLLAGIRIFGSSRASSMSATASAWRPCLANTSILRCGVGALSWRSWRWSSFALLQPFVVYLRREERRHPIMLHLPGRGSRLAGNNRRRHLPHLTHLAGGRDAGSRF